MLRFKKLFVNKCNIIGMIHVGALPGTPCFQGSVQRLVDDACREAEIYNNSLIDGVLLENMHDIPYIQPDKMGPETIAVMSRVCSEVRRILHPSIPCGIQILAGGNREAIAVAHATGLQFIRAEGFVFGHLADEGWTGACAGPLLRYRNSIGADHILVFTDIKKKHSSHAITADVSLTETAQAAEFFLSDGVIITGTATGQPTDVKELKDLKRCAQGPILIGSGVTTTNLHKYLDANGIIVGTNFKKDGRWQNAVDGERVKDFMDEIEKSRSHHTD